MNQLVAPAKPARARGPRHTGKRETILSTAARLFAERGFEATSLDAIADELGMHKATLYHYISSKQEVLYQCLVQSFADLDEVIVAVQDPARTTVDRLRHFALALARAQNNEYGRCLAMVGPRPLVGDAGEKIRDFQRKLDSTVRALVKEGMARGELRETDPGLLAAMLFGTLNWVPNWYRPGGRLPLDEIVNRFVDMLVHGIEAVPAATPPAPAKAKKRA
ncbi:MAG: TetR/AcrR family transcriptional regulator [Ramlibacter sp.]